ncbi:hypothetical protein GCM10007301_04970 [Azorhizobium oxalatiphilum]|uniref:DUF1398 domain-containing protein n=1 Tax=Azorhizobium oxalatiphilum TaxID=980631 RepID=A0A917F6K9_9HYPH|nr:DUF1398 domain-containing protein [Azorhizobium oxalatiphilum]GGF48678.1 hypothetical protein GCM10007301_04970 [Azorhizobium oxalatiphilum]
MDAQRIAIAERCLAAAYDGTMSFPEILGMLGAAGIESYMVDYRRGTSTYFLPDGDSVVLDVPSEESGVAAAFDPQGLVSQIRWAQANPPDYSYRAFCANVKAMGCAGYLVSLSGRRVLYFGRTAEPHVEHFP